MPPSSEHEVKVCSLKVVPIPPLLAGGAEICGVILCATERYRQLKGLHKCSHVGVMMHRDVALLLISPEQG